MFLPFRGTNSVLPEPVENLAYYFFRTRRGRWSDAISAVIRLRGHYGATGRPPLRQDSRIGDRHYNPATARVPERDTAYIPYREEFTVMTDDPSPSMPEVRTGQTPTKLTKEEYLQRWRQHFCDPAFEKRDVELGTIAEIAWEAYNDSRKAPRTRKAGRDFADPEHELPIEWLEARQAIIEARRQYESAESPSRVLVVCASPRTDQTCPSEMSKTFRITQAAKEVIERTKGFEVDFLDLSVLTAEYGRVIYPCKSCVSTAMPLCHWPCSCYPNHYLGQSQDWMHEIYPRWVAAHGIMIVTPVHRYQVPSMFKLMMDRWFAPTVEILIKLPRTERARKRRRCWN